MRPSLRFGDRGVLPSTRSRFGRGIPVRGAAALALVAAFGAASVGCHPKPSYSPPPEHHDRISVAAHGGLPVEGGIGGGGRLPALVGDGDGVFLVGNSFMGWEGRSLGEWVTALGREVTPPIRLEVAGDVVFGNTPLAEFLEHAKTQAALASHRYKVFVLQAEELEPVDHKAAFQRAVRDFDKAIRAAGARTVLFMTWEFPWRPFLADLARSYDEIGRELGIPVIPVGLIYRDCTRRPYGGDGPFELTADNVHPNGDLHPNAKGAAVNAYATFALLTGRNPGGMNFRAPGNTNDDALMRHLSEMAWAEVLPRLRALPGAAEAGLR